MLDSLAAEIAAADAGEFWFFLVFVVLAAGAAFIGFFHQVRRARLIEDTPTARIRSAPQGYVELEGLADLMDGTPIVSPLTGRHCVWGRYRGEKRESCFQGGKRRRRWRTIRSGQSDSLFLLRDGTGECVIDPEGAEVRAARKRVWYGDAASPRWTTTARSSRWPGGGSYRYKEWWIPDGAPLYGLGEFRSLGHATGADVETLARQLVVAWKRDPEQVARFDADTSGELDLQEFQALRQAARQRAAEEVRELAAGPATHLLSRASGRPFILSSHSQAHLARRYRWLGWGLMVVALVLVTVVVWIVNARPGPG